MRKTLFRSEYLTAGIPILLLTFLLSACTGRGRNSLPRVDLFSISLGTLPNQLEWFYREGFRIAAQADIQYQDGRIYLAASSAGKVMVFSSYGELLTLIFDSERNPEPRVNDSGEGSFSFQKWPLRNPFAIAVQDSNIFIEDTVSSSRRVASEDQEGWNDRIILRFNSAGGYLEHLGREGIGGSPFPPIWSIDIRDDEGIVVTTFLNKVWKSFWYDKEGNVITTLVIQESQLPDYSPNNTVYSVRPDPAEFAVHIRVDHYVKFGNTYEPEAMLYTFNMNSLEYSEPLKLRFSSGDEEKGFPPVPPEHLGVTPAGQHVLLGQEGVSEYRLSLVSPQGRITQHRRIAVDSDATIYRHFRLNQKGLLIGIFFSDKQADVSLWRLDKLDN